VSSPAKMLIVVQSSRIPVSVLIPGLLFSYYGYAG
jgi:hypothetical protein